MIVPLDQYVELRGDNVLSAVVKGTEANAYLVATAALARGAEATAEQYHISLAQVHGTLAFYYENRAEIERRYLESEARLEESAVDGWQHIEEMRTRKDRNAQD